jgi:integrase
VAVLGQRHRISLKTSDKREAKALEKELLTSIAAGKAGSQRGRAFARLEFCEAAQKYQADRLGKVSERTMDFETERLRPLSRFFGGVRLYKISDADISRFQQHRIAEGVSPRTINMEVGILRRILKRGKLWAQMAEDVTMFPETSHIGRALTAEQKTRLFRTAASRPAWLVAHCAAVLAVSTTCRKVELRHLRWADVNLFARTLRVNRSKTEAGRRTIPLNADAIAALGHLRSRAELLGAAEQEHFVFPACESGRIDPERPQKSWRTAWRNLTRAADLVGFRFHDLRHTAVTELAETGAADATLQALAGHLSHKMLEHYSHIRMEAKRAAVDQIASGLMGEPQPEQPTAAVQ